MTWVSRFPFGCFFRCSQREILEMGFIGQMLKNSHPADRALTHTHTRLKALCPGLPGWAGTRKVKPIWILLKQQTVSGSGIRWAICKSATSLQTDNHASIPPLSFLQARCPSCHPTNSVKALTDTRLMALFPGLPGWASTRKSKPNWILLKQETVSGSGISWAICKSAPRSRQITTPAPHHSEHLIEHKVLT